MYAIMRGLIFKVFLSRGTLLTFAEPNLTLNKHEKKIYRNNLQIYLLVIIPISLASTAFTKCF